MFLPYLVPITCLKVRNFFKILTQNLYQLKSKLVQKIATRWDCTIKCHEMIVTPIGKLNVKFTHERTPPPKNIK